MTIFFHNRVEVISVKYVLVLILRRWSAKMSEVTYFKNGTALSCYVIAGRLQNIFNVLKNNAYVINRNILSLQVAKNELVVTMIVRIYI